MYILFKGGKKHFSWQDNLAFPLLCSDWNVDEEMLLLEVICLHTKFTYHWNNIMFYLVVLVNAANNLSWIYNVIALDVWVVNVYYF